MTQENIAYNWNISNMSTLTHALLLVVLRPSLPTPLRLPAVFITQLQNGLVVACSD